MAILIEACVETAAQARDAVAAGADRVELCGHLGAGGLTPPLEVIHAARGGLAAPLFVMVRERAGSFACTVAEVDAMVTRIAEVRAGGADGVVCGVLTADGAVDLPAMRRLVSAAAPLPVTFHRAFDEVADVSAALEALVSLGVARVLSGGGRGAAIDHVAPLRSLVTQAAGRITVMAGGAVRPQNVLALVRETGVTEVHARMDDDPARARALREACYSEPSSSR